MAVSSHTVTTARENGINGLQQEIRTARSQRADRAAKVYTYDARGRITGIQDGNQNQTGYHMDPWERETGPYHLQCGWEPGTGTRLRLSGRK